MYRPRMCRPPRHLPIYTLSDADLEMGASFGNGSCWVTTMGTNAIQNVFHSGIGKVMLGCIAIRYTTRGHRLVHPGRDEGELQPGEDDVNGCSSPSSRPG